MNYWPATTLETHKTGELTERKVIICVRNHLVGLGNQ